MTRLLSLRKGISVLLISCLCLSLAGCSELGISVPGRDSTGSGTEESSSKGDQESSLSADDSMNTSDAREVTTANLGLSLLQDLLPGNPQNILVSPLSIQYALTMLENGAAGTTQKEMEAFLGLSTEEMTDHLRQLYNLLPSSNGSRFSLANSVWVRDLEDFSISHNYSSLLTKKLHSEIIKDPLDEDTVSRINEWVSENTDGMIPAILDNIPDTALLYLINALSFEADWENPYQDFQVSSQSFHNASGSSVSMEFMHSSEDQYLENDIFQGMMKYYKGRDYAFVALLPKGGITLSDALPQMTGEGLSALLNSSQSAYVEASLPRFQTVYDTSLNEYLKNQGLEEIFDPAKADFSTITGSDNNELYVSDVLHKTYIAVTESGTRTAAVTSILTEGAADPSDVITLTFDQPFLYLIIDSTTHTPLFMGVYQEGHPYQEVESSAVIEDE